MNLLKIRKGCKLKIVHVTQFFQPVIGYQETFLAKRQMEQGHDVTVVTSDRYIHYPNYDSIYRPLLGDRIVGPVRRLEEKIDTWRLPTVEFQNHPYCPSMGKVLDELKPDVVHLHNIAHFMALSVIRHKAKGGSYRLIIDEHDTAQVMNPSLPHKIYRKFFRKLMAKKVSRQAHAVVGITTDSCVVSHNQFGVKKDIIEMIPLGSDHRHYSFTEQGRNMVRATLGIPRHGKVIIFTGKIQPLKRPDALVEAMPHILEKTPDAHLVLVGHPVEEYRNHINKRIQELSLEERVHNCDAVPALDLPSWFSMADLGCWPTEVTISMIDASSCNLPILVPRADGVEYQVSGDNGEFINDMSLDPEKLGNQISSILNDNEKLKRLGTNGRRLVEQKLSWDAVNESFMELYKGRPATTFDTKNSSYSDGEVNPYGSHIRPHDVNQFNNNS